MPVSVKFEQAPFCHIPAITLGLIADTLADCLVPELPSVKLILPTEFAGIPQ
jgi:hypothetical protein